jgi:hypothetical protein
MEEQDVQAASNTPITEIFSEIRERAGTFKTSAIIIGSSLNKIKADKLYKQNGFKSLNEYINSVGLSVEMATALMQICDVLANKFPEAYKKLEEGLEDSYLPGSKAMFIASKIENQEITEEMKEEFTKPTGIQKLKRHAEPADKIDDNEGPTIDKLAKSSKIFTKKVLNCDDIPDGLKNEAAAVDKKIQEKKEEATST